MYLIVMVTDKVVSVDDQSTTLGLLLRTITAGSNATTLWAPTLHSMEMRWRQSFDLGIRKEGSRLLHLTEAGDMDCMRDVIRGAGMKEGDGLKQR